MIAYFVLRGFGWLALRWFYRDVELVGLEHLPSRGPVLLAGNHPNALVDALVIGCTLQRPITLTAKATLLENPVTRVLLRAVGVVPLRRASDDVARGAPGSVLDPSRNAGAFTAVLDKLQEGGVVLLFPEGKSHSEPNLAPLKTGLARIAFMARDDRQLLVPIIPVGLTFERKWEPRTRVLMHLGAPIVLSPSVPNDSDAIAALTQRVDVGLREVTLNFGSSHDATRVLSVSGLLAEILDEFRPLHTPDPPLADSVRVAQRINAIRPHLAQLEPGLTIRLERFVERISAFERATSDHAIVPSDVQMSTAIGAGSWFVVRETLIAALAGPLALWGRINHWIPLRIARSFAQRTSKTPDEPAMNTIVAGLVLVLAFYVAQTVAVAWLFGAIVAAIYAISLPLSATWDFRYSDRIRRARSRIKTYLLLRRDPALRERLLSELAWLRTETVALDADIDRATPSAEPQGSAVGAGMGVNPSA